MHDARLVYRGQYGTVRYRGPLPPYEGEWIGIEWDGDARGKHDGVGPEGVRYFTAYVLPLT